MLEPTPQQYEEIFQAMRKDTEEKKHLDCESCGYKSCKDMVRAICNGVNIKENCVHYLKDVAEADMQKLNEIQEKERAEAILHREALTAVAEQFKILNENIRELNIANEASAGDSYELEEKIGKIAELCQELTSSIAVLSEFM